MDKIIAARLRDVPVTSASTSLRRAVFIGFRFADPQMRGWIQPVVAPLPLPTIDP